MDHRQAPRKQLTQASQTTFSELPSSLADLDVELEVVVAQLPVVQAHEAVGLGAL